MCDWSNPNQLWDIHNVYTGAGYVGNTEFVVEDWQYRYRPQTLSSSYGLKYWENEFAYVGSYRWSQTEGDFKCWEVYRGLPTETLVTSTTTFDYTRNTGVNGIVEADIKGVKVALEEDTVNEIKASNATTAELKITKAKNGRNIKDANHIWYHRHHGICVANTSKWWPW